MKHLNDTINESFVNESIIDESIKDVIGDIAEYIKNCDFLQKISKLSKDIVAKSSESVVKNVLKLYYIMIDKKTELTDKLAIIAALTYLVTPTDAIPDIAVLGFTDDVALISYLIATLKRYMTPDIENKATDKYNEWFKK